MSWIVPSVWLIGIGWCFAVPLVGGALAGLWLDRHFGTAPLLVIIGTMTGLGMGSYISVRMLLQFLEVTGGTTGKPS